MPVAGEGRVVDGAGRVTGVTTRSTEGERSWTSDLVVDAMGRGTRARRWLAELGHAGPAETLVRANFAIRRGCSRALSDVQGDRLLIAERGNRARAALRVGRTGGSGLP